MNKDDYLEFLVESFAKDNQTPEDIDKLKNKLQNYMYKRGLFELWCDKHNHKLSLIRTLLSAFNLMAATLVALKVFEVI
tara:strand:- start:2495 stop:2731 length:237 start_codon:yes stop_codon:yes gene_type:complete